MRLEVSIDELVLRGVAPQQAEAVAAELEARLAALATAGGPAPPAREEAFRRLPPVVAPAGEPATLGARVADAVWAAVAPRGGRP